MKKLAVLKTSLILFLLVNTITSFTQNAFKDEYAEINFWVTRIHDVKTDSTFVTVGGGSKQGIKPNTSSIVYGSKKNKIEERANAALGYAIISKVFEDSCYATIIRYDNTNPLSVIYTYDYVTVADLKLPAYSYHSIFFELIKQNTHYLVNETELYDLNTLLYNDSKQLEDSLINICIANLKEIYERFKDKKEGYENLFSPLATGRYKGLSVIDMLNLAQPKDILAFAKYTSTYTSSYGSNEWNFPEIFATWVLNNAPYSKKELQDSLLYFEHNAAERKRIINENAGTILHEEMVYYWAITCLDLIPAEKFSQAHAILDMAIEVGLQLNDTSGLASAYLYKAETYQNEAKYSEAIQYCIKSRYYFNLLKNHTGILKTNSKESYCLYSQQKYDEAILIQKKIIEDFYTYKNEFSTSEKEFNEPKIFYFLAYSYYQIYDFKNAIENFKNAIRVNNEQNTLESRKRNITYYDMVARIYKQQGQNAEALTAYTTLLESYKNLSELEKVADTYNSIASVQFNLGDLNKSIENYNLAFNTYLGINYYSSAGFSKSGAAQAYYRLGKYDTAIILHREALVYRKMENDFAGVAYSWNKLGSLYTDIGEKNNALAALDSAVTYYSLTQDSTSLYDVYITHGNLFVKEQNNIKAVEKFQKAYALATQKKNTINTIECAYNIGSATYSYDTASSRKYFTICYLLSKNIGDVTNQIYSLLNLGNLASLNFKFVESKSKIDEALKIADANANPREKAICYKFMARIYTTELNIDKANEYYLKAIHLFDSLGEVTQNSNLNSAIANNYITKGDFNTSEKYYFEALRVARVSENILDQSDALSSIGYLYSLTGNFDEALKYADSSVSLLSTVQNDAYLANAYLNKGGIYQHTSDYKQANYFYSMADSIYHKENNLISWATSQNNIGTLYYWQADFDGCLPYIKNAYNTHEKINFRNESWLLFALNLGEAYLAKKDYVSALGYLLPAYKIAKEKKLNRMIAVSCVILGKVEYERKNYVPALNYLKEANEYGILSREREKIIESSLYLGRVYLKLNNREQGTAFLQKCVDESAKYNIVKFNWEALYDLGVLNYEQQKYDSSVFYFKQAINIVEENSSKVFDDEKVRSKFSSDSRKVDLYSKIIAASIALHDTDAALDFANRSNIQGMKDKISQGGVLINDEKKSEAIKRAQQLDLQLKTVKANLSKEKAKPTEEQNQAIVQSYERTILNVEANYKNYIDSLVSVYPNLTDNFAKHANPEEFKTYKKKIPADVAVVLYIVNEDNLFIFTVTNESKKVSIVKIKQTVLETKIKSFISLLNVPDKSAGAHTLKLRGGELLEEPKLAGVSLLGTSEDLYKILIEPIAADIKGKTKLCIIPNGKLCNIPFQVLGGPEAGSDFRFLVEDYSIFYINKLDVFLKTSLGNDSLASMAAFGNPDFHNTQVNLPSAEKEVKDIQVILNSGDYYYGKEATEEQAKKSLESKHFIHFATHGILDNSNFKNSYIKFSSDAGDDGNLSINEINGLELADCDMVVLSACETAITNDSIKGWYYSAANSFIESGAKTVIASLWSVDDNATSLLMTAFYKNLKTMPKADALRQAQATLSKNPLYVHPFFWGAFVLYGDWR